MEFGSITVMLPEESDLAPWLASFAMKTVG
jgi:hypothetical protein